MKIPVKIGDPARIPAIFQRAELLLWLFPEQF